MEDCEIHCTIEDHSKLNERSSTIGGTVGTIANAAQLCFNEPITSAVLMSGRKIGITMSEFLLTEAKSMSHHDKATQKGTKREE
jgi:hypothetical protein